MALTPKSFEHLIGMIPGLSEKQLRTHFKLYLGYLNKYNEIEHSIKTANPSTADYSHGEISELLRRSSVAFNGALLHELYFENLNGEGHRPTQELMVALENSFGSLKHCLLQLRAGLLSEPGWILLTRSRIDGSLKNNLIGQHHIGVLVEQDILLALDGWEHSYFIDYSTNKNKYIDALERVIDWNVVGKRYEASGLMTQVAA